MSMPRPLGNPSARIIFSIASCCRTPTGSAIFHAVSADLLKPPVLLNIVNSLLWSRTQHPTACLVLLLSLAANSAHASEYAEIQRLANSGQTHLALVRVEKGIAQNPKDPQLRFLQGVIQADSGMVDAAEQTFIALTRLYPELPEPYNNLAALYAKSNRFGKAREALESALRLNPNYAVAHENLGDVYARLAAESYASAQQLDQTNPRLAPKLTLARQLLNGAAVTPQ